MDTLNRPQLFLILLAQSLVALPLLIQLPKEISLYWLAIVIWRVLIAMGLFEFPSQYAKLLAMLAGITTLVFSLTAFLSLETFVAFFIVSFSLKLTEFRNKKDGSLILTLTFLALGISFIFYQSIYITFYALSCLAVILHTWSSLYRIRKISIISGLRSAALVVGVTLPLMVLLFVVMPRFGQLWSMPAQTGSGTTGFSTSMSPGTFSNLIRSNKTAFRVIPESGALPLREQRYWRGITLEVFDGIRWTQHKSRELIPDRTWTQKPTRVVPDQVLAAQQSPFEYSVLLEPHNERALFMLLESDASRSSTMSMQFQSDNTLIAKRDVVSRLKYSVRSWPTEMQNTPSLSFLDKRLNTALLRNSNIRARHWGESLRARYGSGLVAENKIVSEVLTKFNREFSYTLQPPLMEVNGLDAFLFEHKRGFCEHFASSFVYVMRAAGIPARVVIGYQGGEYNAVEKYIAVRQRDAHAWAEVWINSRQRWQRIDPTAYVAPERIQNGLLDSVPAEERVLVGAAPSRYGLINWARNQLEVLNYRWQLAVINFDSDTQSSLLNYLLGGVEPWRIALLFLAGIIGFALIFLLAFFRSSSPKFRNEESKLYYLHCKRLAQAGYEKKQVETPLAFAKRVGRERPSWRVSLLQIASAYTRASYAEDPKARARFKELCRPWKPK